MRKWIKAAQGLHRIETGRKHGLCTQAIRPVPLEQIPAAILLELRKLGKTWITKNTRCPCGSGKRFKACCMVREPKQKG